MQCLFIEPSAEVDLVELFNSATTDAQISDITALAVLLDEIGADRDFLSRMHKGDVRRFEEPSTHTARVVKFWREGYNVLRLKVWNQGALIPYRVIYAYDPRSDAFHILGIIHRTHCYDASHPRVKKLLTEYLSLGIPRYR